MDRVEQEENKAKAVIWEGPGLTEGKRSVKKVSCQLWPQAGPPSLRVSSVKRGRHLESAVLGNNGDQE